MDVRCLIHALGFRQSQVSECELDMLSALQKSDRLPTIQELTSEISPSKAPALYMLASKALIAMGRFREEMVWTIEVFSKDSYAHLKEMRIREFSPVERLAQADVSNLVKGFAMDKKYDSVSPNLPELTEAIASSNLESILDVIFTLPVEANIEALYELALKLLLAQGKFGEAIQLIKLTKERGCGFGLRLYLSLGDVSSIESILAAVACLAVKFGNTKIALNFLMENPDLPECFDVKKAIQRVADRCLKEHRL